MLIPVTLEVVQDQEGTVKEESHCLNVWRFVALRPRLDQRPGCRVVYEYPGRAAEYNVRESAAELMERVNAAVGAVIVVGEVPRSSSKG